jgi:cyclopropane fatty-acyl-phospholipid synthase-like methyltransferase
MGLIEELIPRNAPCRLLEFGCVSGVYIRRACELNPQLTAVGLESQTGAVDFARRNIKEWGLDDRSVVHEADIRSYNSDESFDLATMHNLIYYFPLHEREALFKHVRGLLTDSGRLVLTTLTKGSDPSIRVMDLWAHMTEGYGSLPVPDSLRQQLINAGYRDVQAQKILGDFYTFTAEVA